MRSSPAIAMEAAEPDRPRSGLNPKGDSAGRKASPKHSIDLSGDNLMTDRKRTARRPPTIRPPNDPLLKCDPQEVAARFWSKVQKSDGCWEWQGTQSKGYGRLHVPGGNTRNATHIAYWLETGSLPPNGTFLCHRCDNPACVRFDHLYVGTQTANMLDRNRKGRQAKGSANGSARLTEEAVMDIRSSSLTSPQLAAKYGRPLPTILSARHRQSWRHLP